MRKREKSKVLEGMLASMDEVSLRQTENRMTIAASIADRITACGMTQAEFAQRMGRATSEISDWLSGTRNFTVNTLSEIECALGIRLLERRAVYADTTRECKSAMEVAESAMTEYK